MFPPCKQLLSVRGAGPSAALASSARPPPRRAVSFRYCGDTVRYYDRPGAIPQVGVSHGLKDGDRLFAADYPIVWPKPWPGLRLAGLFGPAADHSVPPCLPEFAVRWPVGARRLGRGFIPV